MTHETLDGCPVEVSRVLLDPSGRLLVSGWVLYAKNDAVQLPVIARFRADGALDTTFGDRGLIGSIEPTAEIVRAPDGTLVTAMGGRVRPDGTWLRGSPHPFPAGNWGEGIVAWRDGYAVAAADTARAVGVGAFRWDGSPHRSFGKGGLATATFADRSPTYTGFVDVAGSARRIYAFVRYQIWPRMNEAVFAFDERGSLDPRFGQGGRLSVRGTFGSGQEPHTIIVDSAGRVVLLGGAIRGGRDVIYASRYTAGGRPDLTFGRRGSVQLDLARETNAVDYQTAGVALPDGGLLLVASATAKTSVAYRLKADGTLEPGFGRRGFVSLRTVPQG